MELRQAEIAMANKQNTETISWADLLIYLECAMSHGRKHLVL